MIIPGYLDRVTGLEITQLGDQVQIAGRYLFVKGDSIFANGSRLRPGNVILPGPDDKLLIETSDGTSKSFDLDFQQFPDDAEQMALVAIGERLEILETNNGNFGDWEKVSPLPLMIDKLNPLKLTEFELALQRYNWHIAQICSRPYTQLIVETERLPVSQARRIPARAYGYLASHTEDWEYPTFTSVVPRKILSTLPDDFLDFYENRLAVRLVNEVDAHLLKRKSLLSEIQDWGIKLEKGRQSHRRQSRVLTLLGEAMDKTQLLSSTDHVLRDLVSLFEQNHSLFGSTLYKAIPATSRATITKTVHSTNILVNDRHYRYIKLLWTNFLRQTREKNKSIQDVQQELQELYKAFDRFVMLLICRALSELGYQSEETIARGKKITLISSWNKVDMQWDTSGVISLSKGEVLLLRIVPIATALISSDNFKLVKAKIHNLYAPFLGINKSKPVSNSTSTQHSSTVVVYSGSALEISKLPLELQKLVCSIGTDLLTPLPFGLIPVRSYDLGSLERIGRALRWSIFGNFMRDYPISIPVPVKYRDVIMNSVSSGWLKEAPGNKNSVLIVNEPEIREKNNLFDLIHDLRGDLVRQGQRSHRQEIDRLDQFLDSVNHAEGKIQKLRICPVCKRETRLGNFHMLDNDCFEVVCLERDCGAIWGLRLCQSQDCNRRYPYMRFSDTETQSNDNNKKADWVDSEYGMDTLAMPCATPGTSTFICPFCGNCGYQFNQGDHCKNCQDFRQPFPWR